MSEAPAHDRIFDLLDQWRHLPDYQLERRADIFFALYLPEFLRDQFNLDDAPHLIPEFPIRLASIRDHCEDNRSCKVDYLAVAKDHSRAFLVELKTDSRSLNAKQDQYLCEAAEAGLGKLLSGVGQLCGATKARGKYCHLLRLLGGAGLLPGPDCLRGSVRSDCPQAVNECASHAEAVPLAARLEIVYLLPDERRKAPRRCSDAHVERPEIGISTFADWLPAGDDRFSSRFRASLSRWARTTAGSVRP